MFIYRNYFSKGQTYFINFDQVRQRQSHKKIFWTSQTLFRKIQGNYLAVTWKILCNTGTPSNICKFLLFQIQSFGPLGR